MNEELALYLLSGAGILIMSLLTVIGFGLKRFVKSIDNNTVTMEGLRLSLNTVCQRMKVQESNAKIEKEYCGLRHLVIDKRFDKHSTKLEKHEKEITKLKTIINN